jgi:hypothetical protein
VSWLSSLAVSQHHQALSPLAQALVTGTEAASRWVGSTFCTAQPYMLREIAECERSAATVLPPIIHLQSPLIYIDEDDHDSNGDSLALSDSASEGEPMTQVTRPQLTVSACRANDDAKEAIKMPLPLSGILERRKGRSRTCSSCYRELISILEGCLTIYPCDCLSVE